MKDGVLPVNAPAPNADALFEQAQAAEAAGDIAEAERLYRVLMNCDPTDAAAPFNLWEHVSGYRPQD
jgi:hypothetical protein